MTILSRCLLAAALVAAATGASSAAPVGYRDPDTATHPHLTSYTTRTVEDGKETFKESYEYAADGRLKKRMSYKDGQLIETVEYTWDPSGRLTKRLSKDDTGPSTTRAYVYTLDKSARIETVLINAESKEVYRWDKKGGREVTASHPDGKGNDVFEMSTTFDAADNVVKRCTSTAMVTEAIKAKTSCELREYDKHGQVKRISTKPASKYRPTETFTNSYDKQSRLTKVVPSDKDGTVKAFTWNANGDIATVDEGGMVTTFAYVPR